MLNVKYKLAIALLIFGHLFCCYSCEKEEWVEAILDETCSYEGKIIDTLNGCLGTVQKLQGSSLFLIYGFNSDSSMSLNLHPCNLPEELYIENLEIKFDGYLLDVQDWIDDTSIQYDFVAAPFFLGQLEYKIQ